MLQARPVTAGDPAYAQVRALYREAFPYQERFPIFALRVVALKPEIEFLAFFDPDNDNCFCGLTYTAEVGKYLYILYLAVPSELRGKGYGSQILAFLREQYPSASFVLEIEPLDKKAKNYEQRLSRLEFYKRHGFRLAGYDLFEGTVQYTMLATGDDFDPDEFSRTVRKLTHGLYRFKIVRAE